MKPRSQERHMLSVGLLPHEWELVEDRPELPLLEQNPFIDNIEYAPESEACASIWRESTKIQHLLPSAVVHKAARGR